ncbi:LysM peptidoglycan-binding domain-containing protein [Psychromonas sp. RZ5]|nr:LysM peptidoglycan-binding domain-containing protein [Psychromonas sp. RZ5]
MRAMKYKLMLLFVTGIALSLTLKAQELETKSPRTYIVKEGDTLWQLSANLLDNPMLWPKLWKNLTQINQSTQSPHLIYPGDQLTLHWIKDEPQLAYKRKIKLSPDARLQEKVNPISIIPTTSFADFVSGNLIVNPEQLQAMPRLVNMTPTKTRFIEGDIFYAAGQFKQDQRYGVYRLGSTFKDLLTGEALGTELLFIGYSKVLLETNNPKVHLGQKVTSHRFIKSTKEAREGDLIAPITEYENVFNNLVPRLVSHNVKGHILAVKDNQTEAAQWDVVIIDKGKREQLKLGSVFSVLISQPNQLRGEVIGELMVINVYEKVSVAVVLHAKQAMRVENKIQGGLKKQ